MIFIPATWRLLKKKRKKERKNKKCLKYSTINEKNDRTMQGSLLKGQYSRIRNTNGTKTPLRER